MKMLKIFLAILFLLSCSTFSYAKYVRGYTTKSGKYVSGYYRSNKNKTVTDNYSYKGNYNPYTGKKGTNKYTNSKSSPYYKIK